MASFPAYFVLFTYYTFKQRRDWDPLNVGAPGCIPVSTPFYPPVAHRSLLSKGWFQRYQSLGGEKLSKEDKYALYLMENYMKFRDERNE